MQIICPPDSPPVVLDDYLRNGEPLVICTEKSNPEIAITDTSANRSGDGTPFALTSDAESGYTAYFALRPGKLNGNRFTCDTVEEEIVPVLVVARDRDASTATRKAVEEALHVTGSLGKLLLDKPPLPEWLDQVGLSTSGDHAEILSVVESLPVRPGYVLIEEGWEEEDPQRFPIGLGGLSQALRQRGIPHLGVAHSLRGQSGQPLGDTFQFFFDFYAQLKEQGVTFVQVDHERADAPRNLQIAIQAAAAIQFNSAIFNRQCLSTENLVHWTTSRLVRTDLDAAAHLQKAFWLQHLMVPMPPAPDDEASAILAALSGGPLLIKGDVPSLERVVLPSGLAPRANIPLTICDEALFGNAGPTKAYTFKSGCGVVATFDGTTTVSARDFAGRGDYALHTLRAGYLGLSDGAVEVNGQDILTFAPIVNGVGLLGHPHYYLLPGPLQEMHYDEETIHIASRITGPLLLFCGRDVLEVRCNGQVIPWDHDKASGRLMLCEGRELQEQPSLYTISFES